MQTGSTLRPESPRVALRTELLGQTRGEPSIFEGSRATFAITMQAGKKPAFDVDSLASNLSPRLHACRVTSPRETSSGFGDESVARFRAPVISTNRLFVFVRARGSCPSQLSLAPLDYEVETSECLDANHSTRTGASDDGCIRRVHRYSPYSICSILSRKVRARSFRSWKLEGWEYL